MDPNIDKSPSVSSSPSPVGYSDPDSAVAAGQPQINSGHGGPGVQSDAISAVPLNPQGLPPELLPLAAVDPQSITAAAANDDATLNALDEEWVNKAKAIVEKTKASPYIESHELSKAKADYLRIRYNKQLKVAEDMQ